MPSLPSPRSLSPQAWALLWTAVVLLACWTPGGTVRGGGLDVPGLDKVVHTLLFFPETFLLLRALHGVLPARTLHGVLPARTLRDGRTPGRISWVGATALAGGLAILTEIVQIWVPNRDGSVMDLLADFLGILLGAAWYLRGRRIPYDERTHL